MPPTGALFQHPLHTRHQYGCRDIECPGEPAQCGQGRLPDTALDLTDERAINAGFERKRLLRKPSGGSLLPQHFPKRDGHLFCSHDTSTFALREPKGPRDISYRRG